MREMDKNGETDYPGHNNGNPKERKTKNWGSTTLRTGQD